MAAFRLPGCRGERGWIGEYTRAFSIPVLLLNHVSICLLLCIIEGVKVWKIEDDVLVLLLLIYTMRLGAAFVDRDPVSLQAIEPLISWSTSTRGHKRSDQEGHTVGGLPLPEHHQWHDTLRNNVIGTVNASPDMPRDKHDTPETTKPEKQD
ncbi:uncharacterized protein BO66DRAFT_250838 [Aspergillus aculeatinus CBS 121060]|uniref:Uncharacterized protein n=1 Tax=Aspergillus aculeatinus CBS 121060 TaxID=1448322 RepID=A0ACD1HGJ6_9EURO|nr:hypothetical protein BO66DRAFT_250838 [Aspergillus aculeatinus CBS 121060]RAH72923.1 hypothetical protein BO66DRAFT_250838 [Aspergillus aculeatinus CBS 121060]